ncbi:hypothetical protein TH61_12830 [Rufibacter sp. DG15C]|uniref:hypothetical protein n=1 Tax=Rufibacter sp. DG15C TaxID=1379909 RepID=UPI00078D00E6|nr:hypothetical protein [Rufibacter sp. DG15C]AMM51885.1 hypothetical protein TH61_12830 [Rufibacter sp. DG15C]
MTHLLMKIVGNILDITHKRDTKHQGIEVHLDRVEYLMYKKDGHYLQDFNYIDDLDAPLVITGDRLARIIDKKLPEGEYDFKVYDLVDGEYEENPDKFLSVLLIYDFEEDQHILSSLEYSETVPMEEFKKIKGAREKEKLARKNKAKRR